MSKICLTLDKVDIETVRKLISMIGIDLALKSGPFATCSLQWFPTRRKFQVTQLELQSQMFKDEVPVIILETDSLKKAIDMFNLVPVDMP